MMMCVGPLSRKERGLVVVRPCGDEGVSTSTGTGGGGTGETGVILETNSDITRIL